jgi:hypothetical protein
MVLTLLATSLAGLEFRVFDLLLAHGENAPSLVFCPYVFLSIAFSSDPTWS